MVNFNEIWDFVIKDKEYIFNLIKLGCNFSKKNYQVWKSLLFKIKTSINIPTLTNLFEI